MGANSTQYPILDSKTLAPTIVRFGTPYTGFLTSGAVSFASSGDNTVVSAVTSQIVRVYRIILTTAAATNITMKDGASTSLSGAMPFGVNGSLVLDMQGEPWYVTSAGNAFIINSSNAVQVSGTVYYIQA